MSNLKYFLIVLALIGVMQFVGAISNDVSETPAPIFVNTTPVTQTELLNHDYVIHHINQGDSVYLGDHLDISGVVAGNKALVWFRGGEPDPAEQPYVIDLPETKAGYYDFPVDPAIFSQMTGWIYKWNGYYESNGNTKAFYVIARYRTNTLTYPNGTVIESNVSSSGQYNETTVPKEPLLPVKHVADYLTVHSQNVTVITNGESKLWVLGRVDGIYDQLSPDNQSINDYQIRGLESGSYQLLIQYPGKDGFGVSYKADTQELYTRTVDQPSWIVSDPISLTSLTPILAADTIKAAINSTNDTYDIQSLVIQEPSIQLVSMDQVSTGSAKEYYKNPDVRGNVTLFDVKGYTNVQPGTIMNFALDEKEQTRVHWFNTTALEGNPGDMREFEVYIPVYWDDLKAGVMHTISGYTDIGGSIFRDFPVRESPDHTFIPEQSVKWIGSGDDTRNPWVPTPTPITVTQVVTQMVTVTVPVTPSNEQVLAQQMIAENITSAQKESDYWRMVEVVGVILIFVVVLILGVLYLRSVNRRAKNV